MQFRQYILAICPECKRVLENGSGGTMKCATAFCGQNGIEYEAPEVELRPVKPKGDQ
jgi:hypothetical protein